MGDAPEGAQRPQAGRLRRDRSWVARAREAAFELVGEPGLAAHPGLAAEVALFLGDDDTEFLLKS